MLLSCRYRLPSEAFPSMFATSSRCGRRRSGNRCRSISAVSWSASLHVPPSTRGCRVFANERKRRGRALDLPASCAPVTRIERDRRRRCIRAGRGAGGLGSRRTVGGIHGHRGDIGCPRVGVGRGKQHSASVERSSEISRLEANSAHRDLLRLDLELFPFAPFAERVWALRSNLTAYDAWYVALAEALNCALATLDRKLCLATGPVCDIVTPAGRR